MANQYGTMDSQLITNTSTLHSIVFGVSNIKGKMHKDSANDHQICLIQNLVIQPWMTVNYEDKTAL